MSRSNIAIIGCGYIGEAVALDRTEKGDHVTATARTPERLDDLSKVAQKSVILKGNDEDEFIPLIANNQTILVTVAPESVEYYESAYLHTAEIFRRLALEMDLPRNIIFTSSTSVYGDHQGMWVDETSDLLAKDEQAKILIEAEKTYASLEELGWDVCIFRLAEIYGPEKELSKKVRSAATHAVPGEGNRFTNMIHKADCVNAIHFALRYNLRGIYNLADDDHPTRQELYDMVAKEYMLPAVKWDPTVTSLHSGNKRVSNHKIKKAGYKFIHPHRVLD
ncbi:MAG TPA: SDR family oxidoreductase [Chlamydiales bacterium]|nr:SDR family oxidoreductase [Chlamydiales bacterium]